MEINKLTLPELKQKIDQEEPVNCSLFVRFADYSLEIATNSQKLKEALKKYFSPFLIRPQKPNILITLHQSPAVQVSIPLYNNLPAKGKKRIKEEYADIPGGRVVRKKKTGLVFVFNQEQHLAIGPCLENINQVVNFINNRFAEQIIRQGALMAHAAAVKHQGKGIVIAGNSGMGKSTIALRLMTLGSIFVSNDRILFKKSSKGCFMWGLAKNPRINPGTVVHNTVLKTKLLSNQDIMGYAQLDIKTLWELEDKQDVFIEEYFGRDRFQLTSRMDYLILLNWEFSTKLPKLRAIDPQEEPELLESVIKDPGIFFYAEDRFKYNGSFESYVKYLKGCQVFELSGGIDFDQGLELIARTITN